MKYILLTTIILVSLAGSSAQTNYALTPLPDTVINGQKYYLETITEVNDAGETVEGTELIDSTEYIRRVYRDASNAAAKERATLEEVTLIGIQQRTFNTGNSILLSETGKTFWALQNERAPGTRDYYPEFEGTWRIIADTLDLWVRSDLGSGLAREIDPQTGALIALGRRIRFLPKNAGFARVQDVTLVGPKLADGQAFQIVRQGGEKYYRQVQTRDNNGNTQARAIYIYVEPYSTWRFIKFGEWIDL